MFYHKDTSAKLKYLAKIRTQYPPFFEELYHIKGVNFNNTAIMLIPFYVKMQIFTTYFFNWKSQQQKWRPNKLVMQSIRSLLIACSEKRIE